uniref:Uncharacterized protein n=1 Tax=Cacopsylla melanoneura TaxID=428564 RepID=A0A8D8XGM7_9HEMI
MKFCVKHHSLCQAKPSVSSRTLCVKQHSCASKNLCVKQDPLCQAGTPCTCSMFRLYFGHFLIPVIISTRRYMFFLFIRITFTLIRITFLFEFCPIVNWNP